MREREGKEREREREREIHSTHILCTKYSIFIGCLFAFSEEQYAPASDIQRLSPKLTGPALPHFSVYGGMEGEARGGGWSLCLVYSDMFWSLALDPLVTSVFIV